MTTTLQKQDPHEDSPESRREGGPLEAVIRDNVLSALGCPANLHHVQVRRVWGDNYRVNVFVGVDAALLAIPHSYFLHADGNGKILACCPPIQRAY